MAPNPNDTPAALAGGGADVAADAGRLAAEHPGWFFTSCWVAAGPGPDRRRLVAQRRGVVLSDWSAAGLSAKIAAEEQR